MNGDLLTRWTAVAVVLAVAGVAAWVSYWHAVDVVSAHGEAGTASHLYPVVIDGLIVAASMVLLDAARHRESAPCLAWWMLIAGIAATLGMNVLAGIAAGVLGAVIGAWPALAFVGCYELSDTRQGRRPPRPAGGTRTGVFAGERGLVTGSGGRRRRSVGIYEGHARSGEPAELQPALVTVRADPPGRDKGARPGACRGG